MIDPRRLAAIALAVVPFPPPATGPAPSADGGRPWWQAVVATQQPAPDGPTAGLPGGAGCGWLAPVDAPVVDPFRPPDHPYGAGNRGIEYGTAPGDRVGAVAGGRVTFVGPVAGHAYLVITHPGGIRSTYGPLRATSVVRGEEVTAGQSVADADRGLHLTARLDDRYLDPGPLLDGRCVRPRLVAPPTGSWSER